MYARRVRMAHTFPFSSCPERQGTRHGSGRFTGSPGHTYGGVVRVFSCVVNRAPIRNCCPGGCGQRRGAGTRPGDPCCAWTSPGWLQLCRNEIRSYELPPAWPSETASSSSGDTRRSIQQRAMSGASLKCYLTVKLDSLRNPSRCDFRAPSGRFSPLHETKFPTGEPASHPVDRTAVCAGRSLNSAREAGRARKSCIWMSVTSGAAPSRPDALPRKRRRRGPHAAQIATRPRLLAACFTTVNYRASDIPRDCGL